MSTIANDERKNEGQYVPLSWYLFLIVPRAQSLREAVEEKGHGQYREIEEGDFLKEVTGSDRVICHFYHPEFRRCQIVDKHLTILAAKYLNTKFVKIDVLKAPFFVTKLNVKILPAVIMFKDGIAYDRYNGLIGLFSRMILIAMCVELLVLMSLVAAMTSRPR